MSENLCQKVFLSLENNHLMFALFLDKYEKGLKDGMKPLEIFQWWLSLEDDYWRDLIDKS